FRADLDDEAGVRGAARGGKLRWLPGVPLGHLEHRLGESARFAEEGPRAEGPFDRVFDAVLLQDGLDLLLERGLGALGREAEVEIDLDRARNDVRRAGAAVDVRDLPRRRREVLVALVPLRARELGQRRGELVNRIAREVGVGDVALNSPDS